MIGNYAGAALGQVAESDFSSGLDGMAGSTIAEIPPKPPKMPAAEKDWTGSCASCSLRWTVTPPKEVRPMNAVAMWVLPSPVTVGRLT
jgi:hypothetical protein